MNRIILSIIFLSLSISLGAQIKESPRSMPFGTYSAVTTMFEGDQDRLIQSWWKEFMSEHGRLKKMKKSDVYAIENIVIDEIAFNNAVNMYSQVSSSKENTELAVWVDKGEGLFINSSDDPGGYEGVESLLKDFRLYVQKEEIKLELEEQNKELKRMESGLSKLKKENESYHKTIEQAKERIAKAEGDIEENVEEQESVTSKISAQLEKINEIMERLESVGKS